MAMETQDLRARVFEVCDELSENGEKCTVRRVLSEIPEYTSTSIIHPFFKEWNELQLKERDRIRKSFQCSSSFMNALVSETERINKDAIKHEKEKSEHYKTLLEDTSGEVQRLGKQLSDSLNEVKKLQSEKQALINEIEVMQQTRDSDYKALDAESKRQVSKHRQDLDVLKALDYEHKTELISLRASFAELKASNIRLVKQLTLHQQRQDNLIVKNQDLNDQRVEFTKEIAVRDARIFELEKVNKSFDLLRAELATMRYNQVS
jgi:chromosome segregation ATPase